MKHNRYLLGMALFVAGAMPVFSQVSNDNENGDVNYSCWEKRQK